MKVRLSANVPGVPYGVTTQYRSLSTVNELEGSESGETPIAVETRSVALSNASVVVNASVPSDAVPEVNPVDSVVVARPIGAVEVTHDGELTSVPLLLPNASAVVEPEPSFSSHTETSPEIDEGDVWCISSRI